MKILHQLKPRRVIVVRGSEENTALMVKQCNSIGARVFAPKRLEMVDATSETHIYQVRYCVLDLKTKTKPICSLLSSTHISLFS